MTVTEAELVGIIQRFDPAETYAKLAELAERHIAANSLFAPLAYDPTSPIHDFTTVALEPEPSEQGVNEIKGLLDVAFPPWREVLLPQFAGRPDLINELTHRILYDHTPFSLVMAHERIEDVAFVMAVLIVVLSERIPYAELVQHFHIVISSMVRTIGAFGLPAAQVLRKVGWVHFSFPRTESIRRGGFDNQLVDASNRLMRLQIGRFPMAIKAVAAPGSVDRVLNLPARLMSFLPGQWADRHRTIHIQPVTPGTGQLIQGYVLAVATVLSGDSRFCRVGRLQMVSNLEEVHRLMEWIAEERYRATLVPTFYHRDTRSLGRFARVTSRLS